jgi:hypothetical protein|tara:strand:+ start:752 stop:1546 length:795 start_codon:yes stop_codon:yes gene_type:complete
MSRATLIDQSPEEENTDQVEQIEATEIQQEVEQPPEPESTLPEKYQGKSLEEVVQMHQEAEKLLGRQSSEVGELRKVVDDYIASQVPDPAPQQHVEPEDDIDYFTDPQGAVNRAIENHPKIREAEEYSMQYKKQSSLATLQAKHPDMQQILGDPKFAEWIKASKIRTQLFVAADQQYDADSADELFTLWKERKTVAQQTAQVEKQARKQQVKAANTGNARGNNSAPRKKTYRRADIIKLMKTDPERYQSLSNEIFQAYAEGRVK